MALAARRLSCVAANRRCLHWLGVVHAAQAPGSLRAGAAFAARRQELAITQRGLASKGIITASSLIAFEKGRSWPRERTRATLEEIVRWPAGTLAAIAAGGDVP